MKIRAISVILYLLRMHVIVAAPTWKRFVLDEDLNVTQCCKLRSGASRLDTPNDKPDCLQQKLFLQCTKFVANESLDTIL
jgi:hypothetical protein